MKIISKGNVIIIIFILFAFFFATLLLLKKYADPLYYSCSYETFEEQVFKKSLFEIVAELRMSFENEILPIHFKIHRILFGYDDHKEISSNGFEFVTNVGNRSYTFTELKLVKYKDIFFNVKELIINKKLCFLLIIFNKRDFVLSHEVVGKITVNFPELPVKVVMSKKDALKYFKKMSDKM